MLRPATDCFAAAGRLQSAWFRTNDPDLNNTVTVLVSIDDWVDAGSKDFYIYDKVHAHGPPDMGRRFWGHLPLSWMHQKMLGAKLYYTLFDNEEARNDEDRLWVLVLRDARRQRPHRWT